LEGSRHRRDDRQQGSDNTASWNSKSEGDSRGDASWDQKQYNRSDSWSAGDWKDDKGGSDWKNDKSGGDWNSDKNEWWSSDSGSHKRSQSWSAGQKNDQWNDNYDGDGGDQWTAAEWDQWNKKQKRMRGEGWQKEKKEKKEKGEKKEKRRGYDVAPEKLHGQNWEAPRETVGLQLVKDFAGMYNWQYPLWDDSRRSYAGFLRNPWTPQECDMYFQMIRDGTNWLQPQTDKGIMPRKTAWMVKKGCECSYRYGPFEVPHCEYPQWMLDLMSQVMPYCGLMNEEDWPNCCNMNLYMDGGSAVGWHSDDEMLFQGKFRDILIISLSFGVTRKFELRYNWPEQGEDVVKRINIASGDLMTMEGMTQKHMQHRVPKEGNVTGPRINLTWRWVVKHTPRCPCQRCRR